MRVLIFPSDDNPTPDRLMQAMESGEVVTFETDAGYRDCIIRDCNTDPSEGDVLRLTLYIEDTGETLKCRYDWGANLRGESPGDLCYT